MKQTTTARKRSLGASEAGAALGLCPWKSPVEVWLEKVGIEPPSQLDKEATIWGERLEEPVAREYAKRMGVKVRRRNDTLVHPDRPWMVCHLDREVVGENMNLECKTAGHWMRGDWGEPGTDQVPAYYLVQVYHQMLVTGRSRADLAVLIGGQDFRIYHFEADTELAATILAREDQFWHLVETNTEPDPISIADTRALWRLSSDDVIEVTHDLQLAIDELTQIKAQIKALEERETDCSKYLMDTLREKQAIVHNDRALVTWKSHQTSYFDKKAFAADYPELAEQYTSKRSIRPLRIK